jgi:hypothetical protein
MLNLRVEVKTKPEIALKILPNQEILWSLDNVKDHLILMEYYMALPVSGIIFLQAITN